MGLLDGKTGIVFGVANKRSIAWAIAQALSSAGMRLAFTYEGERIKENVEELAATLPNSLLYKCDVGSDADIGAVFAALGRETGALDTLVHSVAFAPREELMGAFSATTREGFRTAHDISSYSLVAVTHAALPLLERSAHPSVLAMTYYGAEKVAAGYNVMGVAKASLEAAVRYLAADLGPRGVRVNAISAGPWSSRAASAIGIIERMQDYVAKNAPLTDPMTPADVANTAAFLCSPLAGAITGTTIYVDKGYHSMGMGVEI